MNTEQMILLGLLASAVTLLLRALVTYANYHPGRVVVNVFLYVISAGMALLWADATFPTWPAFDADIAAFVAAIWQYLNEWVALGAPILGTASLIYNLLYEKVVVPLWARLAK